MGVWTDQSWLILVVHDATVCLPMLSAASPDARHSPDMDHYMMRHALLQAQIGFHLGEVPVGAGVAFCSHVPCTVTTAEQLPSYMQSWFSMTKSSALRTIVWRNGTIRRRMPRCCACNGPRAHLARPCPFARLACTLTLGETPQTNMTIYTCEF